MTVKTQQERIEDLTAYLTAHRPVLTMAISPREAAEKFLEAADAPRKPAWPSDESVCAYRKSARVPWAGSGYAAFEASREHLRVAFEADPIIQAAVALVRQWGNSPTYAVYRDRDAYVSLRDAVRETGCELDFGH